MTKPIRKFHSVSNSVYSKGDKLVHQPCYIVYNSLEGGERGNRERQHHRQNYSPRPYVRDFIIFKHPTQSFNT